MLSFLNGSRYERKFPYGPRRDPVKSGLQGRYFRSIGQPEPVSCSVPCPLPPEAGVLEATISDEQYPLRIAWDGILVDDPDHPDDVVRRVREVLELLWGGRTEVVEREACELLGVKGLRDYFRNPRGFFDYHIKRHSKSRRKAPI